MLGRIAGRMDTQIQISFISAILRSMKRNEYHRSIAASTPVFDSTPGRVVLLQGLPAGLPVSMKEGETMEMKDSMLMLITAVVLLGVVSVPAAAIGSDDVVLTADATFNLTCDWTINKSADQTALTLAPGQEFLVNYTVAVNGSCTDSDWAVTGEINVHNPPSAGNVTINYVRVYAEWGVVCYVNCGDNFYNYDLWPNETLTCTYSADLPDHPDDNYLTITAHVKTPGGLISKSDSFEFSPTPIDGSINIYDSEYGPDPLGSVGYRQSPWERSYLLWVGPYESCGSYYFNNTAEFVGTDGATGSDEWDIPVTVPCDGCTLSPGYWKTHSEYGPAPYDDTWALLTGGAGTGFYESGQTWYETFWTPSAGNPYYILAPHYMAGKLNLLNAADPTDVSDALTGAEVYLNMPPSTKWDKAEKQDMIALAETLDAYNNGLIGPGHCSEE